MRRAEKAGRESAERELKSWEGSAYTSQRIRGALDISSPARVMWEVDSEAFKREIGALNVSGRAWLAALEAYDRGYRARLTEALK